MRNFLKPATVVIAVMLSAAMFTGCTSEPEPEETITTPPAPTNVVDGATEAFETTTETVWNHGMDADQLNQVNIALSESLGDGEADYNKVWGVLNEKLNLTGVWVPAEADDVVKAGIGFRVLNFNTMNSIGDVITVKVDPDSLTFNEDFTEAKLDRKGVTVTSEMNDTTGFGDILTKQFNKGGEVTLHLVGDEWFTDVNTLWVDDVVTEELVDDTVDEEPVE